MLIRHSVFPDVDWAIGIRPDGSRSFATTVIGNGRVNARVAGIAGMTRCRHRGGETVVKPAVSVDGPPSRSKLVPCPAFRGVVAGRRTPSVNVRKVTVAKDGIEFDISTSFGGCSGGMCVGSHSIGPLGVQESQFR